MFPKLITVAVVSVLCNVDDFFLNSVLRNVVLSYYQ